MPFDRFDYILAIAEERTLTKASKRLHVSQPALTNYVSKLEDELGVRLFDRSITPVGITRAGRIYIDRMKKIQQETYALENILKEIGRNTTIFTIGIGLTRGNHWLPLILPKFLQKHSEVQLKLVEKGEPFLEEAVLSGECDVAIGVLDNSHQEMECQDIVEEEVLLAVPRSFVQISDIAEDFATYDSPVPICKDRLEGMRFLLPFPGTGFHRCVSLLLKEIGFEVDNYISYSNMDTAYRLASCGLGALFMTVAFFGTKYPGSMDNLAFFTVGDNPYIRKCVAGYRVEKKDNPIIQDFIGITRDTMIPRLSRKG